MTDAVEILDQRRAWLEARQTGISSTDVPKILMLSRYGSPRSVFEDKTLEVDPDRPMSLPAWLGIHLQRTVSELYVTATGLKVRADNVLHRHPEHPWWISHTDYRQMGARDILVECKTRARMDGWGEDGSGQVPPDIWAQCQSELAVIGARVCHVAVLFGHHTFRRYILERDEEFITALIPKLRSFWYDHVIARVPPPLTGLDVDTEWVKRNYPQDIEPLRATTPEQERLIERLRLARQNAEAVELAKDEAENRIKELIGDGTGLTGDWGQITWKRSKEQDKVDWQPVALIYRDAVNILLELAAPGDDAELVAHLAAIQSQVAAAEGLYTRTIPGSRRFLVDFKEEET